MKTRKIEAIFAKTLLLTLSLFVVNNIQAAKGIIKWATTEAFPGSKTNDFTWRQLENTSNETTTVSLSTPYFQYSKLKKTISFALKPKEKVNIPVVYLGDSTNKDNKQNGMVFLLSTQNSPSVLFPNSYLSIGDEPTSIKYIIKTSHTFPEETELSIGYISDEEDATATNKEYQQLKKHSFIE